MDPQAAESLNTMTAAFNDRATAEQAAAELVAIGVTRETIKVFPNSDVDTSQSSASPFDRNEDHHGLFDSTSHLVMTDEERYAHAERMHHGVVMVSALVDENHAQQAEDVLGSFDPIDLSEDQINTRMLGNEAHSTNQRRVRMYAARRSAG